jgi:hypothetical protein
MDHIIVILNLEAALFLYHFMSYNYTNMSTVQTLISLQFQTRFCRKIKKMKLIFLNFLSYFR